MKNELYSALLGACLLLWTPTDLEAQPGSLDPTFNGTGYVIDPVNTLDVTQKILVQDDGKVLVIGYSFDATYTSRGQVFRYLPDGTPDTGFGTNGAFTFEMDNEADIYSAVLTAEGKIIMAGGTTDYQTYRLLLIQLNADGTLDNTFGTNGYVLQSVSAVVDNAEDIAYDVTLDAQGNILVCGSSFDINYVRRPVVARFSPSGVLDTSFGTNGVATIPVMTVGSNSFLGIVVQTDGKIVATGYFGNTELWYVMLLVRFEADGSLDTGFGDAGVVKHNYNNVDDEGEDLALTSDGSILVAGLSTGPNYNYSALLTKYTPDGELDLTFNGTGYVIEDLGPFDFASNVSLMADGRIIIAGSSGDGPPNGFDLAVWKYLPDGTRDITFGTDGLVQHQILDHYTMIYAMEVQDDGKILIGGQARTMINQNYFFTARLENDVLSAVGELAAPLEAMVYPNPATTRSTLTVQLNAVIRPDAKLRLLGADGRLVASYTAQQLHRQGNSLTLQLPAGIAPGTYQLAFEQRGTRIAESILINE